MFFKLESLRGVAACLVILFHSPFNYGEEPLTFTVNSYLFVDFFFVLSGFVMSFAYTDKINNSMSFGSYIALRLGRIYPLHIFMLFVWLSYLLLMQYLYISGFGGGDQFEGSNNNVFTFFTNIALLHSMGIHDFLSWNYPSWSISTEFFAYVAFFIFTVTLDKSKNIIFPVVVSFICYMFLFSLNRENFDITYDFGFIRCLGAFYLGVLVYRLKLKVHLDLSNIGILRLLEILVIVISVIMVLRSEDGPEFLLLSVLSFALIIMIFSNKLSGYLGNLLESSIFRKLGLWSYSIYMWHAIVLALIGNVLKNIFNFNIDIALGAQAIALNCFVLLTTIALSKFSYEYIENKFRGLVKNKVREYDKSMQPISKSASD